MWLDDACPKFLGFSRGWEGNWSPNSTHFPIVRSAEASKHWVLAPSTPSSLSLTSVNLLIICANALVTGSLEDARGGTTGGGVTAQRGPEVKGVGLEFPIRC